MEFGGLGRKRSTKERNKFLSLARNTKPLSEDPIFDIESDEDLEPQTKRAMLSENQIDRELIKRGYEKEEMLMTPLEEKRNILQMLKESEETAKNHQSILAPEDDLIVVEDEEDVFKIRKTEKTRTIRNFVIPSSQMNSRAAKMIASSTATTKELTATQENLRSRGVDMCKVTDTITKPRNERSVHYLRSNNSSAAAASNANELQSETNDAPTLHLKSFAPYFDPMFPFPEDFPLKISETRKQRTKKAIEARGLPYYLPKGANFEEHRKLIVQDMLAQAEVLRAYRRQNSSPEKVTWTKYPSMSLSESRAFYRELKRKKAAELEETNETTTLESSPSSSTKSPSPLRETPAISIIEEEQPETSDNPKRVTRLSRTKIKTETLPGTEWLRKTERNLKNTNRRLLYKDEILMDVEDPLSSFGSQ